MCLCKQLRFSVCVCVSVCFVDKSYIIFSSQADPTVVLSNLSFDVKQIGDNSIDAYN